MAGLAAARMSGGSEFHAAGPACEKALSPNLVGSRGVTSYLLLEADRRPVRVTCAAAWTYGRCLVHLFFLPIGVTTTTTAAAAAGLGLAIVPSYHGTGAPFFDKHRPPSKKMK